MLPISRTAIAAACCLIAGNAFALDSASAPAAKTPAAAKAAPATKTLADYGHVEHEDQRPQPPVFFHEEWKVTPNDDLQHPVLQANVASPNLELKLYGPSAQSIQMSGEPDLPTHPPHIYTALCEQTCALALRDRNNYVDLSGYGKIHWLVRQSGLHQLHAIVKLADGRWLLAEHGDAVGDDYHPAEFTLSESRWIELDIKRVVTIGRWVDKPDLTRVDEVGFTTLMPGSGHGYGGYTDVATFEVYGFPVPRNAPAGKKQ